MINVCYFPKNIYSLFTYETSHTFYQRLLTLDTIVKKSNGREIKLCLYL